MCLNLSEHIDCYLRNGAHIGMGKQKAGNCLGFLQHGVTNESTQRVETLIVYQFADDQLAKFLLSGNIILVQ